MDGVVDEWMDGRMRKGWMDGWLKGMDGWLGGWINVGKNKTRA